MGLYCYPGYNGNNNIIMIIMAIIIIIIKTEWWIQYIILVYVLYYPHITPRDLRGWFAAATLILFYTLHVQSLSSSSLPPPTRFLGIRFPCNVFLRQSFCRPIPIGACDGGGDDGGVDSVGRPRRSLSIFAATPDQMCIRMSWCMCVIWVWVWVSDFGHIIYNTSALVGVCSIWFLYTHFVPMYGYALHLYTDT